MKNIFISDFSEVSDGSLCKFIHARKFNVDASFQLLVNYLSYKKQHPALLDVDIRDPYILTAIKDGLPGVLEERDRYLFFNPIQAYHFTIVEDATSQLFR